VWFSVGMITVEPAAHDVAVLRLQHGKVNALDLELLDALAATLGELDPGVRAVVLTGNGRVFSAGVDLRRVVDGGAPYTAQLIPSLHRAFVALFGFPRPVVAAVDGAAIAGGCILAAACDHRLMADGAALIGASELAVGVPFPVSALEIMRHACGQHADDLLLRARLLDVGTAVAVGLIHEAVPPGELLDRSLGVAADLGALPGGAYAMTKQQLRGGVLERIERDAPTADRTAAELWAAAETVARIGAQLERLRAPR
jgi:enoyl-CoA hydratase